MDSKYNFKNCLHFCDCLVLSAAVSFIKFMYDKDISVFLPNGNGIKSNDEFYT